MPSNKPTVAEGSQVVSEAKSGRAVRSGGDTWRPFHRGPISTRGCIKWMPILRYDFGPEEPATSMPVAEY